MAEEMIRDERYNFLSDYAFFVYKGELDKITGEMKPRDEIEEKWVKANIEGWENNKKRQEAFEDKWNKALEEAEEVLRKYLPKEYWSDGYFKSKEFEVLKKEISERINKEVEDILASKKEPWYSRMVMCGHVSSPVIWEYEKRRLVKILKKEYKIKWKPLYWVAPKKYKEEISKIRKKYQLPTLGGY